jgi:hypothetical protein
MTEIEEAALSSDEQFYWGEKCFDDGNYEDAEKWYRFAADKGHAEAQYTLGNLYNSLYEYDYGWPYICDKQARECYMLAANQGHVKAMFQLGGLHRYSTNATIGEDYAEAKKWYELAIKYGHESAKCCLDDMIEANHKEVEEILLYLAKQGHELAIEEMNELYPQGWEHVSQENPILQISDEEFPF